MKSCFKLFVVALLLSQAIISLAQKPSVASQYKKEGYRLIWADEFDDNGKPNENNWYFEEGFVRNHELQWYQTQNAFCDSGMLVIEARKVDQPNKEYRAGSTDWKTSRERISYTSASVNTRGLQSWMYGRFEMRARIDDSPGMWPAFWTLGNEGEWPSNGEIDIMEYYKGNILANIACGTNQRFNAQWYSKTKSLKSFADSAWVTKFHLWRMDWDEKAISLFVDGELLNMVELKDLVNRDGSGVNPFKQPHYILLNLAVGGDNGGCPDSTSFPRRYLIDYVRVYQKKK